MVRRRALQRSASAMMPNWCRLRVGASEFFESRSFLAASISSAMSPATALELVDDIDLVYTVSATLAYLSICQTVLGSTRAAYA
jgi:hypothetical protein